MKHLLNMAVLSIMLPAGAAYPAGAPWLTVGDWHAALLTVSLLLCSVVFFFAVLLWRKNRKLQQEIHAREKVREELLDAKNRYQTLVEKLPQAIFWKDTDSRYVSVNKAFTKQLRHRLPDIIGKTDHDFYPPEIADKIRTDDLRIMEHGSVEKIVELKVFNKKDHWVQTVKTPLIDEQGAVQGVLGIFWDITEQKLAQDKLHETQRFNESVMRSTLDMVYIYDGGEEAVVYANTHFSELLGYNVDEVRAMGNAFHTRLIHKEDQRLINDMLARCDKHKEGTIESIEFRMHDAIGRWLWFQGRYTPFKRDDEGRVCQVIGTLHDITERVTVENALRIAFDRAQRYLDIVETIIVALDRDGRITLVNRKGAQILGREASELAGKNWFETCLPLEGRQETALFFGMLISDNSEGVEYHENTIVTAEGKRRVIAWHNSLLHDEDGSVIGTLSAGEDITGRKQAEEVVKTEKLRQSMLLTLSQLPDLSTENAMDYALDTALVLTKSAIGYLYFYSEEKKLFTLYSWSNEAMKRCHVVEKQTVYELEKTGLWGEAVRQRKPIITNDYAAENSCKKGIPEGHVELIRHVNLPVFDDGEIVAVIGMANKEMPYNDDDVRHLQLLMDGVWKIKKRIEMEEEIRLLNEDLELKVEQRTGEVKQAHEELSRFFSLTPDLLCITGIDGRFIRCNRAWESTLGIALEDLEGRNLIEFVHDEDREATTEAIGSLDAGEGDVINIVNRFRCHDGTCKWIEWRLNSADNLIYAAARDITEKKKYESALIRAKDEADQANLAKSHFLANISHEIRTPLNAVIGYSELLTKMSIGKKEQGYIESISLAGRNLLRLINDILDLSKIEADMITIRYGAVDLAVVISEIEQIFSFKLLEKNLEFFTEIDTKLPRFLVLDEARIRQVLLNLVGNAVKFTECGFVKIVVECDTSSTGLSKTDLIITVEDSGIGIPEREHEAIFEAFHQQTDQSTRFGGTGLGLSISRKLLEMMNGSISVESRSGKGSRFIVRLHDIDVASIAPAESPEEWIDGSNGNIFLPNTVMVVDDIPSNRDMIATLLGETGLTVLVAQNGEVAVELAREKKPACIIMDVLMPVLDGVSAAKMLKRNPETAWIPIVALTTIPQCGSVAEVDMECFAGRLGKPVSRYDLLDELKRHLPFNGTASDDSAAGESNEYACEFPGEFYSKAQELLGAVKMDDIRVFAQQVAGFGDENHLPAVTKLGKILADHAEHFNIIGVRGILRKMVNSTGIPD